ncbi:hypothetical protein [Spiroplasma endosymbiont of Labia minor]|uniref:hypothetical protein n=1 Tax=Spiroplasma endosymbiont of Labia minor TaxID=3066305 RepID=UPI0030D2E446
MKKNISLLMAIGLIMPMATMVISCGNEVLPDKPIVVTDSGKVNDKSFNESAFNSVNQFIFDRTGIKSSHNYVETAANNPEAFRNAYAATSLLQASTFILPGFNHANTIGGYQGATSTAADIDANVIWIDSSTDSSYVDSGKSVLATNPDGDKDEINIIGNEQYDNLIGITFNTDLAGIYAGIATAAYLNLNDINVTSEHVIGMFGGMPNKYSVNNFLWGIAVGARIWNIYTDAEKQTDSWKELIESFNLDANKLEPILITNGISKFLPEKALNTNNMDWFSGNFDVGGGTAKANQLISQKTDAGIAVAGPQTLDIINSGIPYILGVDTDQSELYSAGNFITSVEKNIYLAAYDVMNLVDPLGVDYNNSDTSATKEILGKHVTSNKWSAISTDGKNKITSTEYDLILKALDPEKLQDAHQIYLDLDSFLLSDAMNKVSDAANVITSSTNEGSY